MSPTSEAVTQVDREAAAELIEATWSFPAQPAFDVRAGRSDDSVTVQAFARHRQSSAPKASPAPEPDPILPNPDAQVSHVFNGESVGTGGTLAGAPYYAPMIAEASPAPLEGLVEQIQGALSWIKPPFVTAEASADELRSRISFCLADAERALSRAQSGEQQV